MKFIGQIGKNIRLNFFIYLKMHRKNLEGIHMQKERGNWKGGEKDGRRERGRQGRVEREGLMLHELVHSSKCVRSYDEWGCPS